MTAEEIDRIVAKQDAISPGLKLAIERERLRPKRLLPRLPPSQIFLRVRLLRCPLDDASLTRLHRRLSRAERECDVFRAEVRRKLALVLFRARRLVMHRFEHLYRELSGRRLL